MTSSKIDRMSDLPDALLEHIVLLKDKTGCANMRDIEEMEELMGLFGDTGSISQ